MKNRLFHFYLSLLLFSILGCSEKAKCPSQNKPHLDDSTLRILISEAASIEATMMNSIITSNHIDPSRLVEPNGETLSCHALIHAITPPRLRKKSFITFAEPLNPRTITDAMTLGDSNSPHFSIIHIDEIAALEWEIKNEKVEGLFTFEAESEVYRGSAQFVARHSITSDTKWYVSTFTLPAEGIKLERKDEQSKWLRSEIVEN